MYGADYYRGPRQYQTKVRNAQEAHEAIRPTEFRRTPQSLEQILESDECRVYELIWKRAVASQTADAQHVAHQRRDHRRDAPTAPARSPRAERRLNFPATCAHTSKAGRSRGGAGRQETLLPKLAVGDQVRSPDELDAKLVVAGLDAKGHQTSPPARYTEASLVKRLEEEGIGRPSTYAPTVATIQRRGYVTRQGKAMVPSFTAFA